MRNALSTFALLSLAALPAIAATPAPDAPAPATATGKDAIAVSGTLLRDKDCQRLRTATGETYVLIGRLQQQVPGASIRVSGHKHGKSACGDGPSILVESVKTEKRSDVDGQAAPGPAPVPAAPLAGKGKRLQMTGTLTGDGVECPTFRTPQGRIYTLAGGTKGFHAGDRVTVTGTLGSASVCQQGMTLEVEDIRRP